MTSLSAASNQPLPSESVAQAWSWRLAAVSFALLGGCLLLTTQYVIVDAGSPARWGVAMAMGAGASAMIGVLRGISGPRFTLPAITNAALLALVAPLAVRGWTVADRGDDARHLRRLTVAIQVYTAANGGSGPADLGVLFGRPDVPVELFRRPGARQALPTSAQAVRDGITDYILLPVTAGTAAPVVCTRPGLLGSWINVGYGDGTVTGHRADSIEAATGIAGIEPPGPAPLPEWSEIRRRRPPGSAAPATPAAAESAPGAEAR